jgi:1-aminocyclopropane-1-carboxylate deaminase
VAGAGAQLGVFFDTIVVCSVTGSTQAGMIAGFAALDRPRRVLGIDASAKPKETWARWPGSPAGPRRSSAWNRELRDDEILLDERYHAGTYGIPDESTMDAMRLAAGPRA